MRRRAIGLLFWAGYAILASALFIWRWNHEAVRLYDAPPIRLPFRGNR